MCRCVVWLSTIFIILSVKQGNWSIGSDHEVETRNGKQNVEELSGLHWYELAQNFVQCDSCNCRRHLNCARISIKVYRPGLRGCICAKCVLGIMPDPENLLSVDMEFDEPLWLSGLGLSTQEGLSSLG